MASNPPDTTTRPRRLDALTPLRFLAAAPIVYAHGADLFDLPLGTTLAHATGASVSFFFVLSGFVLAYNYPVLATRDAVREFLVLRIARLWPLYAFVLLAIMASKPASQWLAPGIDPWLASLAALTLQQAWIPINGYAAAFNGPAWTLSVDLALYLAFPALLVRLTESPWRALAGAWLVSVSGPMLVNAIGGLNAAIPVSQWNWHMLNHMFPVSRVGEFALGIATARGWSASARWIPRSPRAATLLEFGAVSAVVAATTGLHRIPSLAPWIGYGVADWLTAVAIAPLFAATIAVLAAGRGALSRFLARPSCVHLGDLSYATYLLHIPLLERVSRLANAGVTIHGVGPALAFWLMLLVLAHLAWRVVEVPARGAVVRMAARLPGFRDASPGR